MTIDPTLQVLERRRDPYGGRGICTAYRRTVNNFLKFQSLFDETTFLILKPARKSSADRNGLGFPSFRATVRTESRSSLFLWLLHWFNITSVTKLPNQTHFGKVAVLEQLNFFYSRRPLMMLGRPKSRSAANRLAESLGSFGCRTRQHQWPSNAGRVTEIRGVSDPPIDPRNGCRGERETWWEMTIERLAITLCAEVTGG
jgi:hypothetical protein